MSHSPSLLLLACSPSPFSLLHSFGFVPTPSLLLLQLPVAPSLSQISETQPSRFMLRKKQDIACRNGSTLSAQNVRYVSKDHAEGALLGVFVGDAAGATLEFNERGYISEKEARRAMEMPGRGVLGVGPGQVTDDSELTIALADGLISAGPHAPFSFPAHHVASQYRAWYESGPVDAGMTCSRAFSVAGGHGGSMPKTPLHLLMQRAASSFSMASEANGALMRIVPVAIWTAAKYYRRFSTEEDADADADAHNKHNNPTSSAPISSSSSAFLGNKTTPMPSDSSTSTDPKADPIRDNVVLPPHGDCGVQQPLEFYVAEFARQDALLSHPNTVTQDTNAAYSVAVAHLITHPGDHQGAIAIAAESVKNNPKVLGWLRQETIDDLDCRRHQGHVRYAFTLAFYFLRYGTPFEDAISQTLQKGGDTDTNAAIVGGLLGAFHGAQAIPSFMKKPVLADDGRRPQIYRPGLRIEELVENLIA